MEKEKILQAVREWLGAKPEVRMAWVHGSFAEAGRFRDIDVAIYLNRDGTLDEAIEWAIELGRVTGCPVDVTFLNSAPLAFRFHASRGILLLCRNEEEKDRFLIRTWDAYFDFRPVAIRFLQEALSG